VRWNGLVHEWLERRTKGVDRLGDEAEIVG
jgi:hypothetical protein